MEEKLLKKTRKKKRRVIGVVILLALIAALALMGLNIEKSGDPDGTKSTGSSDKPLDRSITMQIDCKELSENMDRLTNEAVRDSIPEDGMILEQTAVAFAEGETVYDCLYRICREKDIHLESSYDQIYKSRYVEGIGHIYEMDAGKQSGWVYEVNGEQPDRGCSAYVLEGGEEVCWKYVTSYTQSDN